MIERGIARKKDARVTSFFTKSEMIRTKCYSKRE